MVFEQIDASFHSLPLAVPSKSRTRAHRVLLFCMLARLRGALDFFIRSLQEGCPYACALLLMDATTGAADVLLSTKECMRDDFTAKLLETFPTVDALLSEACQAILCAAFDMCELDVASIECRHASVRHLLDKKSATWDTVLQALSADFLVRQATLQNKEYLDLLPATARGRKFPLCSLEKKSRKKQRRRSVRQSKGGGGQRAYFHKRMRELATGTRLRRGALSSMYRQLHAEYRALPPERKRHFEELGAAARISHRSGEASFVRRRPQTAIVRAERALVSVDILDEGQQLLKQAKAQTQLAAQKRQREAQEALSLLQVARQSLQESTPPPATVQLPCSQCVPHLAKTQTALSSFHWCNPAADLAKARL